MPQPSLIRTIILTSLHVTFSACSTPDMLLTFKSEFPFFQFLYLQCVDIFFDPFTTRNLNEGLVTIQYTFWMSSGTAKPLRSGPVPYDPLLETCCNDGSMMLFVVVLVVVVVIVIVVDSVLNYSRTSASFPCDINNLSFPCRRRGRWQCHDEHFLLLHHFHHHTKR